MRHKKIAQKLILTIGIIFSLGSFFAVGQFSIAQAQTPTNINFKPSVTVPGSKYVAGTEVPMEQSTAGIINYVKAFYNYGIAIVGIAAAIMLMVGGLIWITAQGNAGKVQEAQEYVGSSIIGLFLVFGAYMILRTINPDLVDFKVRSIEAIRRYESAYCCGGVEGLKSFEVYVDGRGQKIDRRTGQKIDCAAFNMSDVNNNTQVCINLDGGYKVISKPKACGDTGDGYCFSSLPEGWTRDFGEDCPDGQACYYHDSNAKLLNEPCGSRGTCKKEDGGNKCPSGWEWEGGSGGADCGQDLYCCYSFKEEEQRTNFYNCATASLYASCKTGGNENGFCDENKKCQKCLAYSASCTDDAQCKDQAGNEDGNPSGPCGHQVDGDCSLWSCDSDDH